MRRQRWPKRSAPLRSAVFHILMSDELEGILCSFRRLVAPLAAVGAGGGRDDDERAVVDRDLIRDGFRGGERQFVRSYRDTKILLREGGESEHYLLGRVGLRRGKASDIYEFGRFARSEGGEPPFLGDESLPPPASHETMRSHPLDRAEVVRRIVDAIPQQVKDNLADFLKEERLHQRRRAAANGTKKAGATKSGRSKVGSQPQPKNPAQTTTAAAAIPVPPPAGTREKQRRGAREQLDPEDAPAAETDIGDIRHGSELGTTGEGSVKPTSERSKRDSASATSANLADGLKEEGLGQQKRAVANGTKKTGATKSRRSKIKTTAAAAGPATPPADTGKKQRRGAQEKLDPEDTTAIEPGNDGIRHMSELGTTCKGSAKPTSGRSKRDSASAMNANPAGFLKEERLDQKRAVANGTKKAGATKSRRSEIKTAAAASPVPPPEGTRKKQRQGAQEKLDLEDTPATETDNDYAHHISESGTTGEGSVKPTSERSKRDSTSAMDAEGTQLEELVAELRRNLSESEKKSEARKRTAAFHQTKCRALKKECQEMNAAAAEREEKLRASFTELQKRCQHLTANFERKLHDAEVESEARQQSIDSWLRGELRELGMALEEERELRKQREEELLRLMEESNLELTQALEKAMAEVRDKDAEIQKLTASLKRSEMLRPSQKPAEASNKKISKLQRELQETQKKLVLEKQKNASSASATKTQKEPRSKLELKDWIDPSAGGGSGVEVLKPGDSMDGVAVKRSGATTDPRSNANGGTLSEMAEAIERESAPIAFSGLEEGEKVKETNGRLDDELAFLASAYSSDEIKMEDGKVTRALNLDAGGIGDHLTVNLTVCIPEEYPESGVLKVAAALAVEGGHCNKDVWKCAVNSLPGLVDACKWEAEGCAGSEALLSVLNIADDWVQNQWNAVHAKRFFSSSKKSAVKADGDFQICHLLVYTHHIVDSEKIHFVKQTAQKHGLGGFIKIGRPGLIVVEGIEENCDSFLSAIMLQRKKLRESNKGKVDSSTFSEAGKVFSCASDLASGRQLPEKITQLDNCSEGMDKFKVACESVGMKTYLEEACKR